MIVEADGSQHAVSEYDADRTAWLNARGWLVVRFWDNEILTNLDGLCEAILETLREREALTLPRLRHGSLPLPQCGRGDIPNRAGHLE